MMSINTMSQLSTGEIYLFTAMLIGIIAVIGVGIFAWYQTRKSSHHKSPHSH